MVCVMFIILEVPDFASLFLEPTCASAGKDPGCCELVINCVNCVPVYCDVELGNGSYCFCDYFCDILEDCCNDVPKDITCPS